MMFKIVSFAVAIITVIFFSGCGSNNLVVSTPKSELFKDKESSYIVFIRPDRFAGGGVNTNIIEFNPDNLDDIKFVGNLSNNEKIIYKVKAGKHYFFTDTNDTIVSVTTKKNEIKNIRLAVTPLFELSDIPTMYPFELNDSRAELINYIKSSGCSTKIKESLLFKEKNEKDSENFFSPLMIEIKCNKYDLVEIKDLLNDATAEELDMVKIVESSKDSYIEFEKDKKSLIKDIKDYYPLWKFKFRDMPLLQKPMIILDNIPNANKKIFDSIKIVEGSHSPNMDKESINEFILQLRENYKNEISKKLLILKITFDKYDNGNMISRYIIGGFGIDKEVWGVIDFKVELIDENNNLIDTFRIFETEMGGFLGGINTLNSDTMSVLVDYINNNYLIK